MRNDYDVYTYLQGSLEIINDKCYDVNASYVQ